ncbi:hypothetical protein L1O03_03470 [Corynebacterium uropygiale]|uniref:Uncharacterized protein n=1 Tax=Corynebacterium uropygiale TaxID=1775911 RepID=A0A9X1QMU5_9CORY|nr:hypothetical protein [Corynebacterium uropygiale]MCF4006237.1 hypothetical protein [Corynebacterium uropygiale]
MEKVNEILSAAGISASDEAQKSAIRACYGKLIEDKRIQDIASENDAHQLAAASAFQQKGLLALLGSAQESQEVYTALSSDMDNVDTVLQALAALLVAASNDARVKKELES